MRLLRNSGNERVIDRLRDWLRPGVSIDLMSREFSLHAFAEAQDMMAKPGRVRLLLGEPKTLIQSLFGGAADISYQGKLQGRWLARAARDWIENHAEIRHAAAPPPQSMIVVNGEAAQCAVPGTCAFTTAGLGITPSTELGLIQTNDTDSEAAALTDWFQTSWNALKPKATGGNALTTWLADAASQRPASLLYFKFLFELFKDLGDELDEEPVVKSATGIRNTTVWKIRKAEGQFNRWLDRPESECAANMKSL